MSILYYASIVIDVGKWDQYLTGFINYVLKALLTLPLLWLFFKRKVHATILQKAILHLVTMPIFIYLWLVIYYAICDKLSVYRFRGNRVVWDIYMTTLFYLLQFAVFHLYAYTKKLKEQELLSAELSKLNVQSELSALKAQLNPHFLYNVFNTINAAIPKTAKNARNMVNELSDLFRYQLKASREELVPLKEEIGFVRSYLDLERQRFAERLKYEIDVAEDVMDELIPPIIIQPIVENAIKHGLAPLIEGGTIKINIRRHECTLRFSICDTGKGIGSQTKAELLKKGVGLSNSNERLIRTYNTSLDVKNNMPQGLCVYFSIPIC